jgi:uncharacterized protein (DUF1919 family)
MKGRIVSKIRDLISYYNRLRLRNKKPSLITNTCIGGILYHELHLKFCSPTINCGILVPEEFITFCEHLDTYLNLPIDFVSSQWEYPVGILHGEFGDITVYFAHYKTEKEARDKWLERVKRVDYNNLYVLMDGDDCSDDQVELFDKLSIKNKVIITMKEYPQYKSVFAIRRSDYPQGKILEYGLLHGGARWYELFDFVHFINTGEIRTNALFRNR